MKNDSNDATTYLMVPLLVNRYRQVQKKVIFNQISPVAKALEQIYPYYWGYIYCRYINSLERVYYKAT